MQKQPTNDEIKATLLGAIERNSSMYLAPAIDNFLLFLDGKKSLNSDYAYNDFCALAEIISKIGSFSDQQEMVLEKLCTVYGKATSNTDKTKVEYITICLMTNLINLETHLAERNLSYQNLSSVAHDSDIRTAAEGGIRSALKAASTKPVSNLFSYFRSAAHNRVASERRGYTLHAGDIKDDMGLARQARLAAESAFSLSAPTSDDSSMTIEQCLPSALLNPEEAVIQTAQRGTIRHALSELYKQCNAQEKEIVLSAVSPLFEYGTPIEEDVERRGFRTGASIAEELGVNKSTIARIRAGGGNYGGLRYKFNKILDKGVAEGALLHPDIAKATEALDMPILPTPSVTQAIISDKRRLPIEANSGGHVQQLLSAQTQAAVGRVT